MIDHEKFQGRRLRKVKGVAPLVYDDGCIGFDRVIFQLDGGYLLISVNNDTDELIVSGMLNSDYDECIDCIDIEYMEKYLDLDIGWLWYAENWMGYADMVVFSFSGIEPSIAFLGAASKICSYSINRITR